MLTNPPLKSYSFPRAGFGVYATLLTAVFINVAAPANAQDEPKSGVSEQATVEKKVKEPVHRVPKVANSDNAFMTKPANAYGANIRKGIPVKSSGGVPSTLPSATKRVIEPTPTPNAVPAISASAVKPVPHPLDDALETARRGLTNIRENVKDYSAIMVKRERVDGVLLKPEYMQVKIRSEGVSETGAHIPFSVYMKFIKPRACAGREVIWVKGQNKNQLCVHEGSGIISLKRLNLDPQGWIAMKGNRYPICEAGMENLVVKLIEKAERDKAAGDCEVVYSEGVKINGRECDVIEVKHPEKRAPYDFHIAKVYIDKELRLPIRYQAMIWPEAGDSKPQLLEEYTYLNVKINQGFTDQDFNPDNAAYNYPRR